MVTHSEDSSSQRPVQRGVLLRSVFSTDHRIIGLEYLWLALLSVLAGMVLSSLLRVHASWPGLRLPLLGGTAGEPELYYAFRLLHGSLMVFFVLTAAPQLGFGNFLLPLQIGAREVAFPSLNRLSFWMSAASLVMMTAAFFPAMNDGLNLWLYGAAVFCLAGLLSAINFIATTIEMRTEGMTLPRMPVTVWAWFINAILSMLIFSVLLAACSTILSDRLLGSHFFSATRFLSLQPQNFVREGSLPVLWQRLFWYFAQAEVYVAMLPCFGIVTHLISTFARKPLWKERMVVLALCGVGVVGFCVWGYHMFATGMDPYSPLVFSVLASSLGVPATFLMASWFGTLWHGRIRYNAAMLFALGFVSIFVAGGLSGMFLARRDIAAAATSEEMVTGHFHLVMGVAATFAILAALYFWFPRLFGTRMNERLGRTHFWLTFVGVYCTFLPMHWLGLLHARPPEEGQPLQLISMGGEIRTFVTFAALGTIAAQAIFFYNFFHSLRSGAPRAEMNPWHATTLEWSEAATEPTTPGAHPTVYRGAYDFFEACGEDDAADFIPQGVAADLWNLQRKPVER